MNDAINIRTVVLRLLSKWYYFLIAALIFFSLAYGFIRYATKVYHVQGSLLVSGDRQDDANEREFLKGMTLFTSYTALEDEIGIIKSFQMIRKAVNELDFGISYYTKNNLKTSERYGEFPFTIVLDSSFTQAVEVPVYIQPLDSVRYRLVCSGKEIDTYNYLANRADYTIDNIDIDQIEREGYPVQSRFLGFTLNFNKTCKPKAGERYFFVIHDLNTVAEDYQSDLDVAPISRESNIISLGMRTRVPGKAIKFVDKLLDVYLASELTKKNQLGLKTIRFIDGQLSGVSDSLKRVEGWLENFRIKSNILDVNATSENLSKNLNRLEEEKAAVEVKLKYYTYISNSLAGEHFGDIVAPSTFGLEDPLLNNLLIELSRLNQERAGLNYNAREENPLAEVVDLKIRNNKRTLLENVKNILSVSQIALNDLDARIDRVRRELNRLPKNERELVNIQRQFDFSDNVYNYLLEKRAEAGIAIASNSVEKTIVDRAKVVGGGPVSPSRNLVYILALILSFCMPVAFVVLRDFWTSPIQTPEDVERSTRIPFIGSIVHSRKQEKNAVLGQKRSPVTESFQSLRVNLQYLTLGKERNVIGFTSSIENEGKTFCAINLAAAISQSGKKTILIDADMRQPNISTYFKFENTKGLSNYLVGGCQLNEIIHPTPIKDFHVITSGPIPPNPLNLVGLKQMDQLIQHLKESYDTIIIDAPPVGYVAEYIILMKYTDANIYVVRSDYTNRYHLSRINKLYEEQKIGNVSVLLNDVKSMRLNGYSNAYESGHRS